MNKKKIRIFIYHASYCNSKKPYSNTLRDALYFGKLYVNLHEIAIK